MKGKAILIILDGFDYEFVMKNIDDLFFFKELNSKGKMCKLDSVVPADSIPSWTTIYTGMNPAEHGVIQSIDYLNDRDNPTGDASVIKGKTFWDEWNRMGKKVFVYNPFMAYPAWDVNGIMISGPVFEGGEVSTNRPDIVDINQLPPLGGLVDHPTNKTMKKFFEDNMKLTQSQFDSFCKLFEKGSYDCAFLGILTSDRMQHFLWKYCDESDRCHPKNNELKHTIHDMYKLMENNVKLIFDKYNSEYDVVVISDHGHGRRCQKTFYINQWLINQRIIQNKDLKKRAIEFVKNGTLTLLTKMHSVQSGSNFFKKFKFAHKVKNADYVFNDKKKRVYAPKFDGTNPFGGVEVNIEEFPSNKEYEEMRQKIIDGLLKVEDHGKKVMLWVKRREEIYNGDNIRNYPEIIYRMDNDYGVDRGLFGGKLFGISAFHEMISGGHRFEGIILGNRDDVQAVGSVLNIHNYMVSIANEE